MKGWAAAVALVVVAVASGLGLWATWDSTRTVATDLGPAGDDLVTTTTSGVLGASATTTVPPAPPCTPGDAPVDGDPDTGWDRLVIDAGHGLPAAYVPPDLVSVSDAGFAARDRIRALVVDDLAALRAAAEASGTPMVIVSAYRSYGYQQQLFDAEAAEVGEQQAALTVARPGHSEHQLGTAVDVLDAGSGELTTDFAATPLGQWLGAHAHEFGFVISYPAGADAKTCHEYEPWHLRYVGRDVARQINASGVTAREWLLGTRAGATG
ncbi:MAG TPA: M15 family metallopeptidase [Acidimicrobiales bacterium]|nr:M15 family metallopeptidase [Acidimicrobiales bacterium]